MDKINRGAGERALTRNEIEAKFMENAELVISRSRAERIRAAVLEIEGPGARLRKHEHALMHVNLRRISAKDSKSAPRRSNRDQTKSPVSAFQSLTYNRLS